MVDRIRGAQRRIVFAAPGLSREVAEALVLAHRDGRGITVILDPHEDTCRIGYGEATGLKYLQEHADDMKLCQHAGLRMGLLITDNDVAMWSPPPQSVDGDSTPDHTNGVILEGSAVPDVGQHRDDEGGTNESGPSDSQAKWTETSPEIHTEEEATTNTLADDFLQRLENDHIGNKQLQPESLKRVVEALEENPPEPFDLSRKVRVFSTRFQYVEAELQGAEWIRRRIKVSNLLLNADLPEDLEDILETQVRPYQGRAAVAIDIPTMVAGQIAYNQHGEVILKPTTQRELEDTWKDIKKRYLFTISGFGVLLRKRDLKAFRTDVEAFEQLLQAWVFRFRQLVQRHEDEIVRNIVESIRLRIDHSVRQKRLAGIDLEREVRKGLTRMRIIEPRVRIVTKGVSWESSRDEEFIAALRKALPHKELEGWFEEFTAVHERD